MLPSTTTCDIMPASDAEEMMSENLDMLGDPFDVLKLFSKKLGKDGNIKDVTEASFFQRLMMNSDKLVSQCMFINVLQATTDRNIILKALNDGAWKTLYGWLQDAKSGLHKSFLVELLKLYRDLPVTVDLLKQNSCAKDIKHLIKCSDQEISNLSRDVVERWMHQVKEKTGETSKKNDKVTNHAPNHVNSKSSKDGKSSTKSTDSASNHSLQSSHKSRTAEDKNLSNNSHYSSGSSGAPDNSNQDSSSSSCASVTKENAQRPKTVKMIGSKFRSTGLEMESPLPHSKKKSTNNQSNSLTVASVKKPAVNSAEKKTSITIPTSSATSSNSSLSPTELKPKIKVIPPRQKPPEIFESSGFMDALGSTEIIPGRRKRKLSQNNLPSQKPSSSSASAAGAPSAAAASVSPSSTEEKKAVVPSFYRDTLEMSSEELSKLSGDSTEKRSLSPTNVDRISAGLENDVEKMDAIDLETKPDENHVNEDASNNGSSTLADEVSEPPLKKKKKAVTWPDESKLCSFFYFQLDETERVNVNKITFAETRKHELEMERQMFQNVKRMAHDTMAAKTQWRKPSLITGLASVVIPGCNSTERKVQIEREQSVLQVLYFNKSMIPDTGAEADMEYFELVEPKDIPLTDESGTGGEVCYDQYSIPAPVNSNPEVVAPMLNMFGNMRPGEMQQHPCLPQPPQQSQMMPPQMRPGMGPVPPQFMQQMYNMQQMPQQMPPNMNMPMMDGRPGGNNPGFDMSVPNQGNNMPGQIMPLLGPRPPMGQGGLRGGFQPVRPDLRPDFMMGPGPQNHPGMMGDMEMNRMPLMSGRNERIMNPQDMPPRMMPPRDMNNQPPPRGGPRQVCSHFMNGFCRFGNSCRYLHQRGNGSPH